mgnify:CR=1 FL=1
MNGESGLDEKYSDSGRLKRYLSASTEEAEVGVDADADVDDDALEDGVDDVDLYVFVSFCVSSDRPACEWNCCGLSATSGRMRSALATRWSTLRRTALFCMIERNIVVNADYVDG